MLQAKWLWDQNRTYIPDADECQDKCSEQWNFFVRRSVRCWTVRILRRINEITFNLSHPYNFVLVIVDVCVCAIIANLIYVCDYSPLCKLLSIFWSTSLVQMPLFHAIVFVCTCVCVSVSIRDALWEKQRIRAFNPATSTIPQTKSRIQKACKYHPELK